MAYVALDGRRFVDWVVVLSCDTEAMVDARSSTLFELPIACSLDASEGGERLAQWRGLAAKGMSTVRHEPDQIVVRYRCLPGVLEELEELAAAERRCCSFAKWHVIHDTEYAELHIRSDAAGLAAIAALLVAE